MSILIGPYLDNTVNQIEISTQPFVLRANHIVVYLIIKGLCYNIIINTLHKNHLIVIIFLIVLMAFTILGESDSMPDAERNSEFRS